MPDDFRIVWNGDRVMSEVEKVNLEALWLVGKDTIRQARDDVPRDTGTLRRSGHVSVGGLPNGATIYEQAASGEDMSREDGEAVEALGSDPAVYVSYSTPYAIKQHEDMSLSHIYGGGKWLERAVPRAWARLGTMVRRARRRLAR